MITILCSISEKDFNDSVAPQVVHLILSAKIRKTEHRYARYLREKGVIELIDTDHNCEVLKTDHRFQKHGNESARYCAVRTLTAGMQEGDKLNAVSLSDLGENAEEAETIYFYCLQKGIEMSFSDAGHIDTQLLGIHENAEQIQKTMISKMIRYYYDQRKSDSQLDKEELQSFAELRNTKKKYTH